MERRKVFCNSHLIRLCYPTVFRPLVEKYAADEDASFAEYDEACRKLSELGFAVAAGRGRCWRGAVARSHLLSFHASFFLLGWGGVGWGGAVLRQLLDLEDPYVG